MIARLFYALFTFIRKHGREHFQPNGNSDYKWSLGPAYVVEHGFSRTLVLFDFGELPSARYIPVCIYVYQSDRRWDANDNSVLSLFHWDVPMPMLD